MSERRIHLDYLLDIQEALRDIRAFIQGMDRHDFIRDKKTCNAVVRSLEVIGEAAAKLPSHLRDEYTSIPWTEIIGMRNKLIHEYFGVDLDIVWVTITEDTPPLEGEIARLIESHPDE